jgi:glutamate formiminotransferase
MPSTLVECVPNFSEGRDAAKVDAIVEAMKIPGVYLLDREMDADHNRCVITLVGEREAIEEAAIRGVGKAAELIDLNTHQGASPHGRGRRYPLHPHRRRHTGRLRRHVQARRR